MGQPLGEQSSHASPRGAHSKTRPFVPAAFGGAVTCPLPLQAPAPRSSSFCLGSPRKRRGLQVPGDGGRPQPHLCGAVRPPRLPRASVNNLQTRHPWLFQNTELCKVTRARAHIPTHAPAHAPAHMHPLPGPGQGGRRTPGVLCRAEPERTADPVFACARSAWGASRMSRMREQSPWDGRGRVARRPGSTTCSPKGLGVRRRHLCSAWGSCSCRLTRCPPDLAEATRCIYHYTSPTYSLEKLSVGWPLGYPERTKDGAGQTRSPSNQTTEMPQKRNTQKFSQLLAGREGRGADDRVAGRGVSGGTCSTRRTWPCEAACALACPSVRAQPGSRSRP